MEEMTLSSKVWVREATLEDREVIWQWWNAPVTRQMMKKNDYVPWEEHCAWFEGVLHDDDRILCVGLLGSEKLGVVRFDLKGDRIYEVSINLNPAFRGEGLAPQILEASIEYLRGKRRVRKLFATLKKINIPSMKSFARADFVYVENPKVDHAGLERFEPESELYCERFFEPQKRLSHKPPLRVDS